MRKLRYMLEQPENLAVLITDRGGSEKPTSGANQQATDSQSCVSGASEATREALNQVEMMIWSAPLSDMGRQAEQETTCPGYDEYPSNKMDLRPRIVRHVPDPEHHGSDPDVGDVGYRTHRPVIDKAVVQ